MAAVFGWLEATGVAATVRESQLLTGVLSAVHLLGFTLTTGGGFVANLRLLGVLLRDSSLIDVAGSAGRGVAVGLAISVTTGALLFAPRAVDASANRIFRAKMLLLAAAAAFHFTVHRSAARTGGVRGGTLKLVGATGLLLWSSVAMAGAAYILLE